MRAKPRAIGPGTIAMIIGLLAFITWKAFMPGKVTIERRIERSGDAHVVRKPSVEHLLSWSSELTLTSKQRHTLANLQQEERLKIALIDDQISKAVQGFNEFLEEHKAKGVEFNDTRQRAEPISELSWQKRQLEQIFAVHGWAVLDASQKIRAEQLAKSVGIGGSKLEAPVHEK